MKKIIAFGASSSSTSINHQLVEYAASCCSGDIETEIIRIRDLEVPMYGVDDEAATGIPHVVQDFQTKLAAADGYIISVAENSENVTAYFKSLFDWISRLPDFGMKGKPLLLMSTSPGRRG